MRNAFSGIQTLRVRGRVRVRVRVRIRVRIRVRVRGRVRVRVRFRARVSWGLLRDENHFSLNQKPIAQPDRAR